MHHIPGRDGGRAAGEGHRVRDVQVAADPQSGHLHAAGLRHHTDRAAGDEFRRRVLVDRNLTDKDIPPFVAMTGNQTVHGHARLQVFELNSAAGLLPISAEDPTPRTAKAIFIDEKTGSTIATAPLTRDGSSNGLSI